jgi:hypothetical protein
VLIASTLEATMTSERPNGGTRHRADAGCAGHAVALDVDAPDVVASNVVASNVVASDVDAPDPVAPDVARGLACSLAWRVEFMRNSGVESRLAPVAESGHPFVLVSGRPIRGVLKFRS